MGLKMTRDRESGTKEEKGPMTEFWRSNIKSLNGKGEPIKDSEKDCTLTVGGKPTKEENFVWELPANPVLTFKL